MPRCSLLVLAGLILAGAPVLPTPAASQDAARPPAPLEGQIRTHIETFSTASNFWVSHVWFAPGTHHLKAVNALAEIGGPAVEPLIQTLGHP